MTRENGRLRHGVIAARVKRMALAYPAYGQPSPLKHPVFAYCFFGILAAGGRKTAYAARPQQWPYQQHKNTQRHQQNLSACQRNLIHTFARTFGPRTTFPTLSRLGGTDSKRHSPPRRRWPSSRCRGEKKYNPPRLAIFPDSV